MRARILIVDDDSNLRESLKEILTEEGYDVKAVENGDAAIEALQQNGFDLMLLDLIMPGKNGVDVLRMSRQVSPDTKVILLTAYGSLETAVEALRFGAHDYILKPSTPYEILGSISRGLVQHAEKKQRKILLEQLESSIKRLMDTEGIPMVIGTEQQALPLKNGVMYDVIRRELWRGDERVGLTPTEGKLLRILIESQGSVMSHQDLVTLIQGYGVGEGKAPEVLRPLISRLRRKLGIYPGGEQWIVNVRGTGYTFDPTQA